MVFNLTVSKVSQELRKTFSVALYCSFTEEVPFTSDKNAQTAAFSSFQADKNSDLSLSTWMCKNSDFQISAVQLPFKVEDRDCGILLVEQRLKKRRKGKVGYS